MPLGTSLKSHGWILIRTPEEFGDILFINYLLIIFEVFWIAFLRWKIFSGVTGWSVKLFFIWHVIYIDFYFLIIYHQKLIYVLLIESLNRWSIAVKFQFNGNFEIWIIKSQHLRLVQINFVNICSYLLLFPLYNSLKLI